MELRRGYAMPDLSGQLGGSTGEMKIVEGLVGPVVMFDYGDELVAVEFTTALDRIRLKYGHIACAEYNSAGELISGAVSFLGLAAFVFGTQSELSYSFEALSDLMWEQGVVDITLKVEIEDGGFNVRALGETATRFKDLGGTLVEDSTLSDPLEVVQFQVDSSDFFAGVKLEFGRLLLGLGDREKMVVFPTARRVDTNEVLQDLSRESLDRLVRAAFASV